MGGGKVGWGSGVGQGRSCGFFARLGNGPAGAWKGGGAFPLSGSAAPLCRGNIKALLRSSRAETHAAEAKEKAEIKKGMNASREKIVVCAGAEEFRRDASHSLLFTFLHQVL